MENTLHLKTETEMFVTTVEIDNSTQHRDFMATQKKRQFTTKEAATTGSLKSETLTVCVSPDEINIGGVRLEGTVKDLFIQFITHNSK